jgi:hypothetical protein
MHSIYDKNIKDIISSCYTQTFHNFIKNDKNNITTAFLNILNEKYKCIDIDYNKKEGGVMSTCYLYFKNDDNKLYFKINIHEYDSTNYEVTLNYTNFIYLEYCDFFNAFFQKLNNKIEELY